MRIINATSVKNYCSYASSKQGGTTLQPGQETQELPLDRVHNPLLQKDLTMGRILIRLSPADKLFIKRLLISSRSKMPPAPPTPPSRKAAPPPAPKVTKGKKEAKVQVPPGQPTIPPLKTAPGQVQKGNKATEKEIVKHMAGPLDSDIKGKSSIPTIQSMPPASLADIAAANKVNR